MVGTMGGLGPRAYTISKTTLVSLVNLVSVEFRGFGNHSNIICLDDVCTHLVQAILLLDYELVSLDLTEKGQRFFTSLGLFFKHSGCGSTIFFYFNIVYQLY